MFAKQAQQNRKRLPAVQHKIIDIRCCKYYKDTIKLPTPGSEGIFNPYKTRERDSSALSQ